ncbi:hypothetical protein JHN55_07055 [Streptomyces sp. MBT56]|uniref:hypothetical protein n=1 Tax=unclassified Streptomyces TaxID=2593676 RepID=UPI00190D27A0|nr:MULTISPECIES: hypothetical protein [unclassified Streptomyces]MBK3556297.1 hypothetical protein [Streptomyces sp. MBT56]MBK3601237.1 hypothetical protein [Streptomyces sp. MBT54]MBK3614527.1 hypothetical protein [Streptomyces sp. MBT98]MBK6042828.1 hypothetical protein [Streptomyces sp. MBT55]
MRQSLYNNARAKLTLATAVRTNGTVAGTTVDLHENLDASRSAMLIVLAGTVTDGSSAVVLQESANGTDWTAVAAANLQGTVPALTSANDEAVYELGYLGSARYLRASVTTSGATEGGTLGAVIVRAYPRRTPISHT